MGRVYTVGVQTVEAAQWEAALLLLQDSFTTPNKRFQVPLTVVLGVGFRVYGLWFRI